MGERNSADGPAAGIQRAPRDRELSASRIRFLSSVSPKGDSRTELTRTKAIEKPWFGERRRTVLGPMVEYPGSGISVHPHWDGCRSPPCAAWDFGEVTKSCSMGRDKPFPGSMRVGFPVWGSAKIQSVPWAENITVSAQQPPT